jgi:hypothetical protein
MPGTWSDGGHRYRPILRGEEVRGLVELDRITPVDATRVCPDRRSEFGDARTEARRLVANAMDIVAVDIAALRPPHGPIHPLESSFDPVVLAAVAEAEAMANEMAAQLVETLHRPHGPAGGPVWEPSGPGSTATKSCLVRSGLTQRSHRPPHRTACDALRTPASPNQINALAEISPPSRPERREIARPRKPNKRIHGAPGSPGRR